MADEAARPGAVTNRYLEGAYAPVSEEVTLTDLRVSGTLPVELDGRYLRNGPNPLGPVDPATYHWFTGDAMVHGLRLRDGRAEWYRNRWVRSTGVSEALGEEPRPGERFGGMDTANTNVVGVGGRTLAIVEAGARPVELSDELDTRCHTDLGGTLPHGYTAHPKVDPATGLLHAVGYHWARPNVLEYTVIDPGAYEVIHRVDVPVPGNPMCHDCSITEGHLVIYDLPVTFNLDVVASGTSSFPYVWDDAYGARVGVMPLCGAPEEIRWFEVDPCYVFHPMNAAEQRRDDGSLEVTLDVVRHDSMFRTDTRGPNEGPPNLWRWRLRLDPDGEPLGRVTETQLDDRAVEFPRVDERRVGRASSLGWANLLSVGGDGRDEDLAWGDSGLVRYRFPDGDGADGSDAVSATEIPMGRDRAPGEAVFVPATADSVEDDGWYLMLVSDRVEGTTTLDVLPAADPTAGPVAQVHLPVRVPLGFHGNWVAAAEPAT
ncbi:MAG: carotenoid oxygenase family protein [Microthrixaceae bacterium]|nr:carotenoid oxygenase family protein [Microthrixaceae bacterium]